MGKFSTRTDNSTLLRLSYAPTTRASEEMEYQRLLADDGSRESDERRRQRRRRRRADAASGDSDADAGGDTDATIVSTNPIGTGYRTSSPNESDNESGNESSLISSSSGEDDTDADENADSRGVEMNNYVQLPTHPSELSCEDGDATNVDANGGAGGDDDGANSEWDKLVHEYPSDVCSSVIRISQMMSERFDAYTRALSDATTRLDALARQLTTLTSHQTRLDRRLAKLEQLPAIQHDVMLSDML